MAYGPHRSTETVPINKHICAKLWSYHNIDQSFICEKKTYWVLCKQRFFVPSLVDLAQWFRRRFLNLVSGFANLLSSSHGKGQAPSLNKLESPSHTSLIEIVPKVLKTKILKCCQSNLAFSLLSLHDNRQRDGQKDNSWWSEKLTWAFRAGELKTSIFKQLHTFLFVEMWKCIWFWHL